MQNKKEAEKLIEITKPYRPKHLYKYRSIKSKGVKDIFIERKVYLSDSTEFDDPFECRPILTFHKSSLKREQDLKKLAKHMFPDAEKKTIKKLIQGKKRFLTDQKTLRKNYNTLIKNIGVYCLSEKKDDLLMWSLYADSHRGFCIEFDPTPEHTLFWETFIVTYQEDYPTVNMMDIGKAEEFRKAYLTKSIHWKNQKEWRILKMEYEGGPGPKEFSPELLTGIIIGALMHDDDKKTLLDWIDQYPTKINIYKAELNSQKYKLDIVPY